MKDLSVHFDLPRAGQEWPVRVRIDSPELTRFDRLELTLSTREQTFALAGSGTFESRRLASARERSVMARLDAGVMPAGRWERTLALVLPSDWPAPASGPLTLCEHVLDVHLALPGAPARHERFVVTSPPPEDDGALGPASRLEVWAESVRRMRSAGISEMRFDSKREEASFDVGAVRVHVHPYAAVGLGSGLRAVIEWPSVGLGLSVSERFASDPPQDVPGVDAETHARFVMTARTSVQLTRFFDAELAHALAAFDRATLDDTLAIGFQRGDVRHPTETTRFLFRAYEVAKRVFRGLETALPPPALAASLAPYRHFAAHTGATLHVGDLSLAPWRVRDVELALRHRFDPGPIDSLIWVDRPIGSDAAEWANEIADATKLAVVTEVHRSGVVLPLVIDPVTAASEADRLAQAVLQLVGPTSASPYR